MPTKREKKRKKDQGNRARGRKEEKNKDEEAGPLKKAKATAPQAEDSPSNTFFLAF